MRRNNRFYQALIAAAFMTGCIEASPQRINFNLAPYIARWYYGIQPQVVMFDVNGVLLDMQGKLIPESAGLIKKCVDAGHTIAILSNCSAATIIDIWKNYYQELGQYITPELIMIPQITQTLKPLNNAYTSALTIITKYHTGKIPAVYFIDDTKMNIDVAQKHGIQGFHLNNSNDYATIERQLRALKVLP